jgi:hypothetical protein
MLWLTGIVCILLLWLWWDGQGAREVALRAGTQLCQKHGVQFLDESVALHKLRLVRDGQGTLRIERFFRFEFATDGASRHKGRIRVLHRTVTGLEMDPYAI